MVHVEVLRVDELGDGHDCETAFLQAFDYRGQGLWGVRRVVVEKYYRAALQLGVFEDAVDFVLCSSVHPVVAVDIPLDCEVAQRVGRLEHRVVVLAKWGAEEVHLNAQEVAHFVVCAHYFALVALQAELCSMCVSVSVVCDVVPRRVYPLHFFRVLHDPVSTQEECCQHVVFAEYREQSVGIVRAPRRVK